jgi:hypothetical protein
MVIVGVIYAVPAAVSLPAEIAAGPAIESWIAVLILGVLCSAVAVILFFALIKEIEPDEFNGLTYKVWRVCCRFSQIDLNAKKFLEVFILEKIKEKLNAI